MVGIDGTEHAVHSRHAKVMLESVTCQSGMVGFDVHLEIFVKAVLTYKANRGSGIEIILMLHGFFWLGLDEEIASKADGATIRNRHFHELSDVFLFKLHIGVEQGFIAFTTAPEHIACCAEFDSHFQAFFDLCGSVAINIYAIGRASAIHEARIAKHVRRCPQAFDACFVHLFLDVVGDDIKAFVGFFEGVSFWNEVDIMEAEVFDAELLHKFKACIYFGDGVFHRARDGAKIFVSGARSEHIRTCCAKIVPPSHGKVEMFFHGFAHDDALCIVVFKSKFIFGIATFIGNFGQVSENFSHWKTLLSK